MTLTAHRWLLAASAFSGAVVTHFLLWRTLPIGETFSWDIVDGQWVTVGAIAGVVLGHFGWVLANPRQRLSRAAAVCALANIVIWTAFVVFTPPVDDSEFQRIADTVLHDAPTIVAGRWHGTFGAVNVPDRLLSLFDPGAVEFAQLLLLSPRYGIDATRRESFAVAGLAFILTTAFWVTFGGAISALRRRYRRRQATPEL
jgi:hypothetical protein